MTVDIIRRDGQYVSFATQPSHVLNWLRRDQVKDVEAAFKELVTNGRYKATAGQHKYEVVKTAG